MGIKASSQGQNYMFTRFSGENNEEGRGISY